MTHIGHSEKVFNMKSLLLILFLTFSLQTLSKANDINDFEIEGMSLGESLLNYMDENLIKKEINNKDITFYYDNDYVAISAWEIRKKFKKYDDVGIVFNPNDSNYKIVALEGTLLFKSKKIKECYQKQREIVDAIKSSISFEVEEYTWFVSKQDLKSHQNSVKYIDLDLKNPLKNGAIRTTCYDIKNDDNLLYVILDSPEFLYYIENR